MAELAVLDRISAGALHYNNTGYSDHKVVPLSPFPGDQDGNPWVS
jgi:hypothetical protein